jgi:hypothetical protein
MNLWPNLSSVKKLHTLDNSPETYLMEQNPNKFSKWANLAKGGKQVAWEFDKKTGGYTGRVWINGQYYTPSEAAAKFLYVKNAKKT